MTEHQFLNLPEHLRERTRLVADEHNTAGRCVVYWMRTAVRADENPALDVAITLAHRLNLPLLVYHAISQHYRFASDRHHTFMLQGARDVQRQFAQRNVAYAFHLATQENRAPHLIELANRAAVVVTEDMPVDPPRRFLESLRRKTDTPFLCVDTACVVPMQLIGKAYTRAFEFRDATSEFYEQRVSRPWQETDLEAQAFDLATLPFDPINLQDADLASLVARCDIDHSVGPVVDTVGGSAAGYARWNDFKERGLSDYAKSRNDPLRNGASRMSAYLHYGMVSPFRIAREADQLETAGSKKYLDELLIWRELAYAFCYYRKDHDQWSALPAWARETLRQHADDRRPAIFSWEQLARAQTGDALWDAAQDSLLKQGELHNNVRMTWGKAFLNWTRSPEQALERMIDLNHRYALDGRDPASYGGLLWCLGQFDRPFDPPQAISGTVRPRPTSQHAKRLDATAYRNKVATPRFDPVPHVAIIGAGISGLMAARTLMDHGVHVTVYEKSRNVGGRMSTRHVEGQAVFDHGAQYFTAREESVKRYVESWREQGVVAQWPDSDEDSGAGIVVLKSGVVGEKSESVQRFVGVPGMNAICQHLAAGVEVVTQTRIERVESKASKLRLYAESKQALYEHDYVIVSAPAPQTSQLLSDFPDLVTAISKVHMRPCWATMAALPQPVTSDWVGAFVHESLLSWVARNSSKPGRDSAVERMVLHATPEWTEANLERDADEIANEMLQEFWRVSGATAQAPIHLQAHRWRYAIPAEPGSQRCFYDQKHRIAACGDWVGGSRVEGAFLSGVAAAGRILGTLSPRPPKAVSVQRQLF